ncbi:hypothetical protein L1887_27625 [Cichorium endivia]|nr:hypothetical protein L1887_27625 [Cichorium endivia]
MPAKDLKNLESKLEKGISRIRSKVRTRKKQERCTDWNQLNKTLKAIQYGILDIMAGGNAVRRSEMRLAGGSQRCTGAGKSSGRRRRRRRRELA